MCFSSILIYIVFMSLQNGVALCAETDIGIGQLACDSAVFFFLSFHTHTNLCYSILLHMTVRVSMAMAPQNNK